MSRFSLSLRPYPLILILLLLLSLLSSGIGGCGGSNTTADDDDGGSSGSGSGTGTSTTSAVTCGNATGSESVGAVKDSSWNQSVALTNAGTTVTSRDITLTLTARNSSGVAGYYLSESDSTPSATDSGWVSVTSASEYSGSVSFSLSTGDGNKTVYGWFKDSSGEVSPSSCLVVTLSSGLPTGSLTLNSGDSSTGSLTVTAVIAGSSTTKITHYVLSESSTAPATDSSLWNSISEPKTSVSISASFSLSPSAGEHTIYAWIKNESNQVSATLSDAITFTLPPPAPGAASSLIASLSINSGSTSTTSRSVSLSLSGIGSATITGYEVSESSTPSSYTAVSSPSTSFSQTVSFTLSASDGTKTVYLHLRDNVGTTASVSTSITLDATAPTGALKLDSGAKLTVDSTVSAAISGSDTIGIIGYYISSTSTTPGINDSGWTSVTSTSSLSATLNRSLTDITGLSTQYLWLKDSAGNVSATISDGIEVVRVFSEGAGHNEGQYTSIAIDSNNQPWISGYWVNGSGLLYYTFANGDLDGDVIDNSADVGAGTSIAIAPNGSLHIAYRGTTNTKLKYAYSTNGGSTWTIDSTLDESGGISPSIGVDSNGKVHVSHQASGNVRYVTNISGNWAAQTVLSGGGFVNISSLALASDGSVHIAGSSPSGLFYTTNEGGAFSDSEKVASSTTGGNITVNNDNVFIAYEGSSGTVASVVSDESGGWQVASIDSSSVDFTVVEVDSQGFIHVVFYDGGNGDLNYATNFSGSWLTLTLDSSGNVGNYCDIAIDLNDRLHISYYDADSGDLKYITTAD